MQVLVRLKAAVDVLTTQAKLTKITVLPVIDHVIIMREIAQDVAVIHGEATVDGMIVNQPVVEIILVKKEQYIIKMPNRHLFFTHLNNICGKNI